MIARTRIRAVRLPDGTVYLPTPAAQWGRSWGLWCTPDRRLVEMQRKGQRVRFFDTETGEQVGPEHRNVVPAMCAAAFAGWLDCNAPAWLAAGMVREVREKARLKGQKPTSPAAGPGS